MLYRQEIIDRWRFPRRRGEMQNPDAHAEAANMFCGDEIAFFMRLDARRGAIAEARFTGEGCALATASADILCEAIEGKPLARVRAFTPDDLLRLYGEPPTPGRLGCVLLAHRAMERALVLV